MKPIIICETLFQTIEQELEEIMTAHKYRFFNHTSEGLVEVNSIQREEDNEIRNCFFVPPSKIKFIEEFLVT